MAKFLCAYSVSACSVLYDATHMYTARYIRLHNTLLHRGHCIIQENIAHVIYS